MLGYLGKSARKELRTALLFVRDAKHPIFVRPLGVGAKITNAIFLTLRADNREANGLHEARNGPDFFMSNWNAI